MLLTDCDCTHHFALATDELFLESRESLRSNIPSRIWFLFAFSTGGYRVQDVRGEVIGAKRARERGDAVSECRQLLELRVVQL